MVGYWSATVPQWVLSLCLYYRPSSIVLIYTCITCSYHSIRRPSGIITSGRGARSHGKGLHLHTSKYLDLRALREQITGAMLPRCIEFGTNGLDSHYQFTFTCYCDSRMITISPTVLDWIFPILTRNCVCTTVSSHKERWILHKDYEKMRLHKRQAQSLQQHWRWFSSRF